MPKWNKEHRRKVYEVVQRHAVDHGIGLKALQEEAAWDGKRIGTTRLEAILLAGLVEGHLHGFKHGRQFRFIPGPRWGYVLESVLGETVGAGPTEQRPEPKPKPKPATTRCLELVDGGEPLPRCGLPLGHEGDHLPNVPDVWIYRKQLAERNGEEFVEPTPEAAKGGW
jgi:hypothetical protein